MKVHKTEIEGILIFEPEVFGDERGFFMETYRESTFRGLGLDVKFVQDNHSLSSKGVLRGLHYQVKPAQGKLVRVITGEVSDVAVDLRRSSKTFGQHVNVVLSAENKLMLWIPPGFAHGFVVRSDNAELVYKCTEYYAPEYEKSLLWSDPDLDINWKIDGDPELSAKDREGVLLKDIGKFGKVEN